jgi:hypothetical protein
VTQIRKRLTYANVMSSIAVFMVLGGATAFAASHLGKNSVGVKQLKKNAVTTAKIKNSSVTGAKLKNGTVTGAKIDLGSLGTVPSATKATSATNATNAVNATNATRATTAGSVDSMVRFSKGANNHQFVTLVQTANFELKGWCDPEETQFAPGLESERPGTVMIIVNRSSVPAFGDSSDDDNFRMESGQEIGFNYQDNGDGGYAASTDGHFLAAPAWANIVADTSFTESPTGHSYPFPTPCHFEGTALVG